VKAIAGKVDPGAPSNKMGNSINENKAPQDTYLPANIEVVSSGPRLAGRRRPQGEGK
jgi:hypothetical protein